MKECSIIYKCIKAFLAIVSLELDILQHFKIRNKQTKKSQGSKTVFSEVFVCLFSCNKSYPGCPIFLCLCVLT